MDNKESVYEERERKETVYYEIKSHKDIVSKREPEKRAAKFLNRDKKTVAYIYVDNRVPEKIQHIRYVTEEIIRRYAYLNNLDIAELYIDCVANELDIDNKVCLNKLLEIIKDGEIGQILFMGLNDISRRASTAQVILEEILKNDVKVVCCHSEFIFE